MAAPPPWLNGFFAAKTYETVWADFYRLFIRDEEVLKMIFMESDVEGFKSILQQCESVAMEDILETRSNFGISEGSVSKKRKVTEKQEVSGPAIRVPSPEVTVDTRNASPQSQCPSVCSPNESLAIVNSISAMPKNEDGQRPVEKVVNPYGLQVSQGRASEKCKTVVKKVAEQKNPVAKAMASDFESGGELLECLDKLNTFKEIQSQAEISKRNVAKMVAKDQNLLKGAIFELKLDRFAPKTIDSYGSETMLYQECMEEAGVQAWPVSARALTLLASVLKVADYKAADCYISAVLSTNRLMGYSVGQDLTDERAKITKALKRGSGEPNRMKPIMVYQLAMINKFILDGVFSEKERSFHELTARLATVALFFLMRVEEVLALQKCHILEYAGFRGSVQIQIPVDKTNQEEVVVLRRLKCTCGDMGLNENTELRLCSVCVLYAAWYKQQSGSVCPQVD